MNTGGWKEITMSKDDKIERHSFIHHYLGYCSNFHIDINKVIGNMQKLAEQF